MRRPALVWGGALGALTVLDVWCDRRKDDSTLSCVTRRTVAAIPAGDVLFTVGLAAGALWFHDHILGPLAAATLNKEAS